MDRPTNLGRPAYGGFLAPSGFPARYATVPVSRLPALRAEYELSLAEASREEAFRGYVDGLGAGLPPETVGFRTILVCAVPARHAIARLVAGGRVVSVPLPSGYWDDGITSGALEPLLRAAASLGPEDALVPASGCLPLKLLAAKCGLVRYGRNGIAYAAGLGSSMAIRAFATDADFEEADWEKPLRLESCAACRACAARCPTGAIREGGFAIDAARCVTLYNEVEGAFPETIPAHAHTALVGCLACQEACPANRSAPPPLELEALDLEESAVLLAGDAGSPLCASISAKLRLGAPEAAAESMAAYSRNLARLISARGGG